MKAREECMAKKSEDYNDTQNENHDELYDDNLMMVMTTSKEGLR